MNAKICSGPSCNRPPTTRGLCGTHYQQLRKGKPLKIIREFRNVGRICTGPECDKPAIRKGLCDGHSQQLKSKGELSALGSRSKTAGMTAEARFWFYVDRRSPKECWNWTGGMHTSGYGSFHVANNESFNYAHRYSYYLATGLEPEVVDHLCWNHSCVNPDHLRGVAQRGNAQNRSRTSIKALTGSRNVKMIDRPVNKFVVGLTILGKSKHIGVFPTLEEAEGAARAARKRYYQHSQW